MENIESKNKSGFLITCGACILLLLVMFYFGINDSVKGTRAAGQWVCDDGTISGGTNCVKSFSGTSCPSGWWGSCSGGSCTCYTSARWENSSDNDEPSSSSTGASSSSSGGTGSQGCKYGSLGECLGVSQGNCILDDNGCYVPVGSPGCDNSCHLGGVPYEPSGYTCETYLNECKRTCYYNCTPKIEDEECMTKSQAEEAAKNNCPSGYEPNMIYSNGCWNYDCVKINYDCDDGKLDQSTGTCNKSGSFYPSGASSATCANLYGDEWTGECKMNPFYYKLDDNGKQVYQWDCDCVKSAILVPEEGSCSSMGGYENQGQCRTENGGACYMEFKNNKGCWYPGSIKDEDPTDNCPGGTVTNSQGNCSGNSGRIYSCTDAMGSVTGGVWSGSVTEYPNGDGTSKYTVNCRLSCLNKYTESSDGKSCVPCEACSKTSCDFETEAVCKEQTGYNCRKESDDCWYPYTNPTGGETPDDNPDDGGNSKPSSKPDNDNDGVPDDTDPDDDNDGILDPVDPEPSQPTGGGNITENPQTGQIAIFVVWVLAFGAIIYSVWYFRKVRES